METYDVIYIFCIPELTFKIILTVERCNGKPAFNFAKDANDEGTEWNCCGKDKDTKCNMGEGDCDRDDDCKDGLICGNDNCKAEFSAPGTSWNDEADCCTSIYLIQSNM